MPKDGDVAYGNHNWSSLTFSTFARDLALARDGLLHQADDPPAGIEPGWVTGSQRGDGFLPFPSRTGVGWGYVGATPADYNRFFRQSINDPSKINSAVGAWSYLNGSPKFLDLVGYSLEDALRFSAEHPSAICVLRGFHDWGSWQKKHGGDDTLQPFAILIRAGATVAAPPEPWHASNTGFLVVGALAAVAGGLAAAASAAATTTTTTASSLLTNTLQGIPNAIIGSGGDPSKLATGLVSGVLSAAGSAALGGAGAAASGAAGAASSSTGLFADIASGVATAAGLAKQGAALAAALKGPSSNPSSGSQAGSVPSSALAGITFSAPVGSFGSEGRDQRAALLALALGIGALILLTRAA